MIYQGTAYEYNQRAEIIIPNRAGTTYYAPQNYTPLSIYTDLDSDIEFFIVDNRRKPVNLNNKTFVAKLVDRNSNSVLLSETLVPVDYDKGSVIMKVTRDDSSTLAPGMYDLIITYTDSNSRTFGLNSDQNNRISFVMEVKQNPLPTLRESEVLNTFTLVSSKYYSSRVAGTSQVFNRDATNTCAVYLTNYTGVFYAQGSLEQTPTENGWFTLELDPENAENGYTFEGVSGVIPFTWDSLCVWVRFYHIPDVTNTGTLDKILYRN